MSSIGRDSILWRIYAWTAVSSSVPSSVIQAFSVDSWQIMWVCINEKLTRVQTHYTARWILPGALYQCRLLPRVGALYQCRLLPRVERYTSVCFCHVLERYTSVCCCHVLSAIPVSAAATCWALYHCLFLPRVGALYQCRLLPRVERYTSVGCCHVLAEASLVLPEALHLYLMSSHQCENISLLLQISFSII